LTNDRAESLHLALEYRSIDFHTPGEFLNGADGITLPEYNYWLRLNAAYSMPLMMDVTATASARYQFDDKDPDVYAANTVVGDRYGADLTFSSPLGPAAHASLSLGYSNELYLRNLEERLNVDGDFRVAVRVNVRPDDTTIVSSGYDSLGQQATLSAQDPRLRHRRLGYQRNAQAWLSGHRQRHPPGNTEVISPVDMPMSMT
jgi:hypothetical protein